MAKFINRIFPLVKKVLASFGIEANFKKNLWYLDSFHILDSLTKNATPFIFDVGACDGSSVIEFRKLFPSAAIHCFEPFPDSFAGLKKTAADHANIFPVNVALSDEDGHSTFYVNESAATNSLLESRNTDSFVDSLVQAKGKISVVTQRLDTYVSQNNIKQIDILKMDVQGAELKVLQGATETLKNRLVKVIYCEIWFTEVYSHAPLYPEVASFLAGFGYEAFGLYNMHYRRDGRFLWGDAIFVIKELSTP